MGTKYDIFTTLPPEEQEEIDKLARKYAKAMKVSSICVSVYYSLPYSHIVVIVLYFYCHLLHVYRLLSYLRPHHTPLMFKKCSKLCYRKFLNCVQQWRQLTVWVSHCSSSERYTHVYMYIAFVYALLCHVAVSCTVVPLLFTPQSSANRRVSQHLISSLQFL